MEYILDLLNRIKWDKNLNPDDYSIFYKDRIEKNLKEIAFKEIKKIQGTFLVLEKDGEETYIPMHRIREVRKNNKLVWKRQT